MTDEQKDPTADAESTSAQGAGSPGAAAGAPASGAVDGDSAKDADVAGAGDVDSDGSVDKDVPGSADKDVAGAADVDVEADGDSGAAGDADVAGAGDGDSAKAADVDSGAAGDADVAGGGDGDSDGSVDKDVPGSADKDVAGAADVGVDVEADGGSAAAGDVAADVDSAKDVDSDGSVDKDVPGSADKDVAGAADVGVDVEADGGSAAAGDVAADVDSAKDVDSDGSVDKDVPGSADKDVAGAADVDVDGGSAAAGDVAAGAVVDAGSVVAVAADAAGSGDAEVVSAEDIAAIRAENEELKAQLAAQREPAPTKGGGWRSVVSWILVAFAVLSVVLAVFAVWLNTTIKDEDRFVATFGTLPEQEEVVTVLSQRVADDLIVATDVEAVLAGSLPTEIAFLSVPVTEGVRQLTTRVAADIIATDVFAGIWRAALRISHQAVDAVLATEGRIAIDLDEAAASISDALAERGVTVFEGQDVDLPEIVLFENDQIAAVAELINFVDTLGWVVPFIALLLVVAAIWVSPDRRRTVAFLGFATGIVLILDLAILRIIRANSVGAVEDEVTRAAAETVWDTTLRFYTQGVWAVIALALLVGFVAWVFGPSARAVRVRGGWNALIARWSGPETDEPRSGFSEFVFTYQRPIQWGAVILGLLFILFGPAPSVASVIITALIVLAVVGFAQAVGGPGAAESAPDETESSGVVVVEEEAVVVAGPESSG